MREKIETLRKLKFSLENFEEDFERVSFQFRIQNHTVKMTREQSRRRDLGRGWDWMVRHLTMTKLIWGHVPFYFFFILFFTHYMLKKIVERK